MIPKIFDNGRAEMSGGCIGWLAGVLANCKTPPIAFTRHYK